MSGPTCPSCPVSNVLSWLQTCLSWFQTCLSCPGCPVPAILFKLACPGHLVQFSTDAPVMSWQSCHLCPFQAHLSKADLLDQPVETVLFQWSCPRCPFSNTTVVLSRLSCLSCPVLADMFWPSILPMFPILAVLYHLSSLAFLSLLRCPGFPFLAVLSWLSCPGCPVLAVLSWLSCPGSPVPAVLSPLSCTNCSAQRPLSTALLMLLPYPDSLVLSVLSSLSFPLCPVRGHPSMLTCPDKPVPAVLSEWQCPRCPMPTVLPWLFHPLVLS
jgi:hypothetical protein